MLNSLELDKELMLPQIMAQGLSKRRCIRKLTISEGVVMRILIVSLFSLLLINSLLAMEEIEKRVFVHATDDYALGVAISDVKAEADGATIIQVFEDSEAEKIGLKKDDIITVFDGRRVENAEKLSDQVDRMEKPKTVTIEVKRDGKSKSFKANLKKTEKHGDKEIKVDLDDLDLDIDIPEMPIAPRMIQFSDNNKGGFLGVEAENPGEQLLSYFKVESGVLVKKVVEKSPAEKSGLKAGDVITKINDRKIEDHSDLVRTLNFFNPGEQVKVHFVREGKDKTITVELAKKEGFGEIKKIHKIRIGHGDDDDDAIIWNTREELPKIRKQLREIKEKHGKLIKDIELKIYII